MGRQGALNTRIGVSAAFRQFSIENVAAVDTATLRVKMSSQGDPRYPVVLPKQ